ncbi:DEAD/DEAH box helicase [Streptomyces marianii]|uniref:DEAD/DEAH box helicase n=1 Tax=Streptomyces marianii TaxID=1817406 RepID=A0A5R9DQQ2_9ACTN|nr:DEAD/DEAH box helicase [Streptomyces marianii]TLQ38765.1 DEAD/DEAH box helicase [Streptomyces marianii]
MPVKLRDHQVEAVEAIIRGLDIPPGKKVPWNGLRAQVHAACGTGKTIIAASAARRIVPNGRILVLVPTLDLLTQTVRAWQEAGHTGPSVAVCSLQDDTELFSMDVRCTTSPPQLALWHGQGPVTIYATYASLGVLAEAFEGTYGQRLAPVDLACIDEAHRTSGSLGKAWADIHDQGVIPATRRLYLTATPRIWEERPPTWEQREGVRERLKEEMAASMDDESIFGPVVYKLTLAQAVQRGLLARYQIIVVELQDPVVTPDRLRSEERTEEELRGQRLGALQAAMLRTMADHGLQTMITFHHRTIEAQAYAEGLERVAKQLHAADPEKYPAKIWASWLQGEHNADRRRTVLGEFATRAGRAVLSNCKVLGEGVDIRAVDSVALLDPKGAPHDIVQAIGRALRQKPNQGKVASLVVPVFLAAGEEPEDMFTSGSYKPLVNVLQALRAHDEEAVELLAIPQANQTRSVNPSMNIGAAPAEGEEENRLLLRFAAPRDPVMVAEWVSFNVIDTERQDWARGYVAAKKFRQREGGLLVPFDHKEGPAGKAYPLGHWISEQRKAYAAGALDGARVARLEALGMVWDVADAAFAENLAAARAYFADHGTLAAPRSATALDRPVGQWLSNQRRPGALAGHPERVEALAAIDPDWNPAWPLDWQRHYAGVRECLAGGAQLADLTPGVTLHGHDVGRWLERQRQPIVWQGLMPAQRERLAQLGVQPLPVPKEGESGKTQQKAAGGASAAFERGLAALRQYKARTGSVTVPRAHVEVLADGAEDGDGDEPVRVKLGVWISNTKSRRTKLTADKLAQLAELGLDWA